MCAYLAALLLLRPVSLHVDGNRLVEDGQPVVLRGVNIPSFESSNEGEFVFRSARIAFEDWHANCIRIPLSQDRWLGKAEGQKGRGGDYQDAVNEVVNLAVNRGRYIILDLDWSDGNVWGQNLGPHDMPDDHSVDFWKDVARAYRGLPHVLFGLYDAPHDVSWSVWRDGGDIREQELTFHAPGMQTLLDVVRKAGAKNVCVVGSLDSAYDLTGIVNGFALKDPTGNGVVYDAHLDPSRTDWETKVAAACASSPVIVGDCSAGTEDLVAKLFAFIDSHSLSWMASSFHPKAKSNLISDWVYAPSPVWGALVKKKLADGH